MTMQALERLIYNGNMLVMEPTPRLIEIPGVIEKVEMEDVRDCDRIFFSTACWRKYLGTWEIKDSRLYLVAVEGIYRIKTDAPVSASWFSGELQVYQGKRLRHLERTYEFVSEFEIIISVEYGLIKNIQTKDNRDRQAQ